jgi:hypothetical protein
VMSFDGRATAPHPPGAGPGGREGGLHCPLCKTKLSVESHFVLPSTDGPIECVKGSCGTGHRFACPIADLERPLASEIPSPPLAGPAGQHSGGPGRLTAPLRELPPEMLAGQLRPRQGRGGGLSASVRRAHPPHPDAPTQ